MNEHLDLAVFTTDEFYSEVGMFIADKTVKGLLDCGLITLLQYEAITNLNRKTFPIISVDLLPKSLDITDLQR